MSRCAQVLGASLLLGSLIGCGQDDNLPRRVPVEVKVTYQTNPVEGAHVTFVPAEGGKPAFGTTDAQGVAQLTTFKSNDGAIPGEYQVTIRKTKVENTKSLAPDDPGALAPVERATESNTTHLLPEKYGSAANSGLQASVSESSENRFDFDLTN